MGEKQRDRCYVYNNHLDKKSKSIFKNSNLSTPIKSEGGAA